MKTKTKSARKPTTTKPATNGKSTRWTNPEKRALFETVSYAVEKRDLPAGVNAADLKSLLAKLRLMHYHELEVAPANTSK